MTLEQYIDKNEDMLMDAWEEYKYKHFCGEYFNHEDTDYWNEDFFNDMCEEMYNKEAIMKVGDKVVIIADAFDDSYTDTDADIVTGPSDMGVFEVKRWDSTYMLYHYNRLQLAEDFYKKPIFDKCPIDYTIRNLAIHEPDLPPIPEEVACTHRDKYLNVISKSLQFWYCRNCGMDWSDNKDNR